MTRYIIEFRDDANPEWRPLIHGAVNRTGNSDIEASTSDSWQDAVELLMDLTQFVDITWIEESDTRIRRLEP